MSTEPHVLRSGQRLGKYEIVRLINRGGMGEVYLARDAWMDRSVAIKVLPVQRAEQRDFRERMQREAQAGARIDHPNCVKVLDGGITDEDVVYLVMEYLEGGKTLRDLMHQVGPFDAATALAYARQIADGVATLHASEILHRDLKPENIMVMPGGRLKIIDFGLARIRTHALRTTLRPAGAGPLGTAHYMSPEQIYGTFPVDEKTDVYATACIVWEMVTGLHIWQDRTDEFPTKSEATARHAFAEPRRLVDVLPYAPRRLSSLLERGLAKNPADRPTAAELVRELTAVREEIKSRAPSGARPGRSGTEPMEAPQPRPASPSPRPPGVARKTERLPIGFVPPTPAPAPSPEPARVATRPAVTDTTTEELPPALQASATTAAPREQPAVRSVVSAGHMPEPPAAPTRPSAEPARSLVDRAKDHVTNPTPEPSVRGVPPADAVSRRRAALGIGVGFAFSVAAWLVVFLSWPRPAQVGSGSTTVGDSPRSVTAPASATTTSIEPPATSAEAAVPKASVGEPTGSMPPGTSAPPRGSAAPPTSSKAPLPDEKPRF